MKSVDSRAKLEYGLHELLQLELDMFKHERDSKSSFTIFEPEYGDEITVNTESAEIEVREHGYFF